MQVVLVPLKINCSRVGAEIEPLDPERFFPSEILVFWGNALIYSRCRPRINLIARLQGDEKVPARMHRTPAQSEIYSPQNKILTGADLCYQIRNCTKHTRFQTQITLKKYSRIAQVYRWWKVHFGQKIILLTHHQQVLVCNKEAAVIPQRLNYEIVPRAQIPHWLARTHTYKIYHPSLRRRTI
jgi:hypothetical protein